MNYRVVLTFETGCREQYLQVTSYCRENVPVIGDRCVRKLVENSCVFRKTNSEMSVTI